MFIGSIVGCTEDFDAPFAQTGMGGSDVSFDSGTGGGAGVEGGSGGFAGASGTGGIVDAGPDALLDADGSMDASLEVEAGPTEDCLNTEDDDGDGLLDCSDPDCVPDYECVPSIPTGWTGVFRLREQAWSDTEPTAAMCPDQTPPKRYFHNLGESFDCDCACTGPDQVVCEPAPFWCSATSTSCQDTEDISDALAGGQCAQEWGSLMSCRMTEQPGPATGSCDGNLTIGAKPPWKHVVDACDQPLEGGGGCGSEEVCLARGGADYPGSACIWVDYTSSCPTTWSERTLVYANQSDLRDCTHCSCSFDPASAGCTDSVYSVYGTTTCSGGTTSISDTSCHALSLSPWSARLTSPPHATATGSCNPYESFPTGIVIPLNPSTFCCR